MGILTNGVLSSQSVFIYGTDGNMLGHYSISTTAGMHVTVMNLTVYFGEKRVGVTNSSGVTTAFATDRLGSSGQFYPYGEGKGGIILRIPGASPRIGEILPQISITLTNGTPQINLGDS